MYCVGTLGKKAIFIPAAKQFSFSAIPTGCARAPSLFDLGDVSSVRHEKSCLGPSSAFSVTGILIKAFLVLFVFALWFLLPFITANCVARTVSTMHLSSLPLLPAAASIVFGLRLPAPGNPEYRSLALRDRALMARQSGVTDSTVEQQRAAAVKDAFTFAWNGYFTTCKGQDELEPVTNTCTNPRNNWGASAVDALSTALVMENQPIVTDILDYIATIDYTTTTTEVSLFETTIRYMAGMLSGYDLLKGPLSNLTTNASSVDKLLTQSKSLAESLSFAFNTSTGIPSNNLNFTNKTNDGSATNGLADIGTLCLEWQHLSDLTGDSSYGDLAQKAETYLLNPLPESNEPFPGLVGTDVNISNGVFLDATGGWNGGDDSFYEYLIKMYVYDSSRYSNYSDRWIMAADSTIKYLTSNRKQYF